VVAGQDRPRHSEALLGQVRRSTCTHPGKTGANEGARALGTGCDSSLMEAAGTRPALGFRRCCVCACEPRGAARRPPWVFQERRGCAGGVWLRSMLSAHMLLQTQLHCCVLARRCGDREGARRRMPRHSAAGFRQRRAGSAVDRSVRASDGMGGGEQPEGSLSGGEVRAGVRAPNEQGACAQRMEPAEHTYVCERLACEAQPPLCQLCERTGQAPAPLCEQALFCNVLHLWALRAAQTERLHMTAASLRPAT